MTKSRRGECVYCGQTATLTIDHIPPRCLFSKPRPSDLIKVPSCRKCNAGASRDDEYFKTVMVLKDSAGDHPEAEGIRSSVIRGLGMPGKRHFTRSILRRTRPVSLATPSGIYAGRRQAFDVDLARLDRVAARIVRGLYWHHHRCRLPDDFSVTAWSTDGIRSTPEDAHKIDQEILQPLAEQPLHSIGRNVMRYRYSLAADQEHMSVWILQFYGDVCFLAVTRPALDS